MAELRADLQELLYQIGPDRRRTQDSPVLPKVWTAFIASKGEPVDLLLTPHRDTRPAVLADRLRMVLEKQERSSECRLAHNQSTVVVEATFDQLITAIVPFSEWYQDHIVAHLGKVKKYAHDSRQTKKLERVLEDLAAPDKHTSDLPLAVVWWLRMIGSVALNAWLPEAAHPSEVVLEAAVALLPPTKSTVGKPGGLFKVSVNRPVKLACRESIRTVKADAAARLFEIDTERLCWAVLDSGIDSRHPVLHDQQGEPRVKQTYDFTKIRHLLVLASTPGDAAAETIEREFKITADEARQIRTSLASGGEVDWETLKPILLEKTTPAAKAAYAGKLSAHGTHVAGILAGKKDEVEGEGKFQGMCPDIRLVDIRILDEKEKPGEFDIIAALQFVRHLNSSSDDPAVHGVNLSIQLQHDPQDYACGRTPVCEECNRLVASGVVVVVAAGNLGIETASANAPTTEGNFRDISIADPGNAEDVITVGSTHRKRPHAYGISYFSSRGPTGDGRSKPDVVAPGEKILGPVVGGQFKRMEGTSMAAPHVSGAAALLMARHSELIGQPRRVKRILCETATDLGRERDFQGAGLIDILRALQSI